MAEFRLNRKKYLMHNCSTSKGIYLEDLYCGMLCSLWNSYIATTGSIKRETNHWETYLDEKGREVRKAVSKRDAFIEGKIKIEVKRLMKIIDKVREKDKEWKKCLKKQ